MDKNEVIAVEEVAVEAAAVIQKPKRARSQKQKDAFKRCQEQRAENARIRKELKEIKEGERLAKILAKAKASEQKKQQMKRARAKVAEYNDSSSSDGYVSPAPQKKRKKRKKKKEYISSSSESEGGGSAAAGGYSDYF
jgi:hypothetical protein